jgi:cytochrome c
MKYASKPLFFLSLCLALAACSGGGKAPDRVLFLFNPESDSWKSHLQAVQSAAEKQNLAVDTTRNFAYVHDDSLTRYAAIVLSNLPGDAFPYHRHGYMERYVQAGGGVLVMGKTGVSNYVWPWFAGLIKGQPATGNETATVIPAADKESATSLLTEYNGGKVAVLVNSEASLEGDAVKALTFVKAAKALNYKAVSSLPAPEEDRFVKEVFATNLNEPMELVILPGEKLLFIERLGAMKLYDLKTGSLRLVTTLPVHTKFEDGLLGLALDPKFEENNWLYLFYSPVGERAIQRVARFTFKDDSLIYASEKVLLEIPVQRDECCHSAGSLEFGPDGNLWISVGDNTNPFNDERYKYSSDGFGPRDERPGRSAWDAQKSSANLNDLRGGILRIRPTAGGGYTIPEGNLLPRDGSKGRPEIYVKGCRNPYRISIDPKKNWLYWGDVGPDAGENGENRGPRGHDEVNLAMSPGFYGWPYFVGDNKAYYDFNYETGATGPRQNPAAPINDSPNNTGPKELPAARPALVYYPYDESPDFPYVKTGGRNAMAGPTYYYDLYEGSDLRLPKYYDSRVFFYDWMRNFILAATLTNEGKLVKLEPFLPHIQFEKIVDMEMDKNGVIYLIEYGTKWFSQNENAVLARINYAPGNRKPTARLAADETRGAAPFTTRFTAGQSFDLDKNDALTYYWTFPGKSFSTTEPVTSFTFAQNGTFEVKVRVEDKNGGSDEASLQVLVGNTPPAIDATFAGNQTFFVPGSKLAYQVKVSDKEDGSSLNGIQTYFDRLDMGEDLTLIAQGHTQTGRKADAMALIEGSDCKACHQMEVYSAGPSYLAIAERYGNDAATIDMLANKIIKGGSGVWGETQMSAHPQIAPEDAKTIAAYIVDLDLAGPAKINLPLNGELAFGPGATGQYLFTVMYKDQAAGGQPSISGRREWRFRPARLQAEQADSLRSVTTNTQGPDRWAMLSGYPASGLIWRQIDLTGIGGFTVRASVLAEGSLELRSGNQTLAKMSLKPKAAFAPEMLNLNVATTGTHRLEWVFVRADGSKEQGIAIDWIEARFAKPLP